MTWNQAIEMAEQSKWKWSIGYSPSGFRARFWNEYGPNRLKVVSSYRDGPECITECLLKISRGEWTT